MPAIQRSARRSIWSDRWASAILTAPRGTVLAVAATEQGLLLQLAAILASGNGARIEGPEAVTGLVRQLPALVRRRIETGGDSAAVLVEGGSAAIRAIAQRVAHWAGPIVTVQGQSRQALAGGDDYAPDPLVTETSISTNTAAAGGDASLMAVV